MEEKKLLKPIQRIKDGEPMPTGMPPMRSEEERTYFILVEYDKAAKESNTWHTVTGISDVFDSLEEYLKDEYVLNIFIGSNEDPILSTKEFYTAHGVHRLLSLSNFEEHN